VWHKYPPFTIDTPPPDPYPHSPHPLDPRHRLGAPAQSLGRGYEVLRNFEVRSSFSVHRVFSPSSCSGGTDDRSPPLLQYTLTFSSLLYLTLPNYYLHHLLQYPTASRTSLLFLLYPLPTRETVDLCQHSLSTAGSSLYPVSPL
jgi:hypothetical protein